MRVVLGVVLLVGGIASAGFAVHGIFHRPGWDRMQGKGALLAYLGAFLALAGLLNLFVLRD